MIFNAQQYYLCQTLTCTRQRIFDSKDDQQRAWHSKHLIENIDNVKMEILKNEVYRQLQKENYLDQMRKEVARATEMLRARLEAKLEREDMLYQFMRSVGLFLKADIVGLQGSANIVNFLLMMQDANYQRNMLRRREKTLKFLAEVDARIARALADDDEDEQFLSCNSSSYFVNAREQKPSTFLRKSNKQEVSKREVFQESKWRERIFIVFKERFSHYEISERLRASRPSINSEHKFPKLLQEVVTSEQLPTDVFITQKEVLVHAYSIENQPQQSVKVKEVLATLPEFSVSRAMKEAFEDCLFSSSWFEFADGCYRGQWSHGLRTGFGIQIYKAGGVYEGLWTNDLRHGVGRMVTEDGECYEGEWFADMHIGEGKYTTQNSQIITVTPKHHGEEVGRTILYSSETPVRVGENIYIGPWKNGLRHGFGVYQWKNGCRYEGNFCDDKIQGFGKMAFPDGMVYRGMWHKSQWHGLGELSYPDGKLYLGTFDMDCKTGYGSIFWKDGRKYRGQIVNGKLHGFGRFIDRRGNKFEGRFHNGRPLRDKSLMEDGSIFQDNSVSNRE